MLYVSGYVSLKSMRRFEKQSGAKARQFVECLSKMAVMGKESSFYEYTKLHNSLVGGHLGINGTLEKIRQRFYWVKQSQDVQWCQSCPVCCKEIIAKEVPSYFANNSGP